MKSVKKIVCLLLVCIVCISSCDDRDECMKPNASRCKKNIVEFCTAEGNWTEIEDCSKVWMIDGSTASWKCCDDGECKENCK